MFHVTKVHPRSLIQQPMKTASLLRFYRARGSQAKPRGPAASRLPLPPLTGKNVVIRRASSVAPGIPIRGGYGEKVAVCHRRGPDHWGDWLPERHHGPYYPPKLPHGQRGTATAARTFRPT